MPYSKTHPIPPKIYTTDMSPPNTENYGRCLNVLFLLKIYAKSLTLSGKLVSRLLCSFRLGLLHRMTRTL